MDTNEVLLLSVFAIVVAVWIIHKKLLVTAHSASMQDHMDQSEFYRENSPKLNHDHPEHGTAFRHRVTQECQFEKSRTHEDIAFQKCHWAIFTQLRNTPKLRQKLYTILSDDCTAPDSQVDQIKDAIQTNPNQFHQFVETLLDELFTVDTGHRLLVEYYQASLKNIRLDVCNEETQCHYNSDSTMYAQILCLQLKHDNCRHKHDIKLILDTAESTKLQDRALAFLIQYEICPASHTLQIKQLRSHFDCQLRLLLQWREPYQNYTIHFHMKEIWDRTGPLCDQNWSRVGGTYHLTRQKDPPGPRLVQEPQSDQISYRGKLKPDNSTCMKLSRDYRRCIMHCDILTSQSITQDVLKSALTPNEKAYFVSYHGFLLAQMGKISESTKCFEDALKQNNNKQEGSNYLLVKGRIYRMMAKTYRTKRQYKKAEKCIQECFTNFESAAPSNEVACAYVEYATILQNRDKDYVDRVEVKHLLDHARFCVEKCEDFQRSEFMFPMVSIEMALFHIHCFERPTSSESPSNEELEMARHCIHTSENYSNIRSKKGNAYLVRQKVAFATLFFHDKNYASAVDYMEEVETILRKCGGIDEHNLHVKPRAWFYRRMLEDSKKQS